MKTQARRYRWRASVQGSIVGFSHSEALLLVFLQVGVAGLHPEGERHLGSEVPVVLDLVVPDLQLPHAAAQLHILLVLEGLKTRTKQTHIMF